MAANGAGKADLAILSHRGNGGHQGTPVLQRVLEISSLSKAAVGKERRVMEAAIQGAA